MEVSEDTIATVIKEITERCDQETPDYGVTAYWDAVISLEQVEGPDITLLSHVIHLIEKQTNVPVSTRIKASNIIHTGGDSLQLPFHFQMPMNENWKGKGMRP